MASNNEKIFRFIRPFVHYIYDSRCCLCGNRSMVNHVHHKDGNHSNNSLSNLVILCPEHHILVHKNKFQLNVESTRLQENLKLEIELWIDSFDHDLQERIRNINVNL